MPLPALLVIKVSSCVAHSLTDGNSDRLFVRRAKGQINKLATSLLTDRISLESVHRPATRKQAVAPIRDEKLTGKHLKVAAFSTDT